jgi:hypothetical protein
VGGMPGDGIHFLVDSLEGLGEKHSSAKWVACSSSKTFDVDW